MEQYFRCGDNTGACVRARKNETCPGSAWTCPINNSACLELRVPVSFVRVHARWIKWGGIALTALIALLVLSLLLRTDPLQKEFQALSEQVRQLDGRLMELQAKPTDSSAGSNPVASLNALAARVHELEVRARQSADSGDADGARRDCQQMEGLIKQAEELRATARRPGNNSGTVTVAARQQITEGEALEGQVEDLHQRAAGGGKQPLAAQCDTLDASVQESLAGFRKLSRDSGGRPPDDAELGRLIAGLQNSYTNAKTASDNIPVVAKPVAPFGDKDATLVIGCTSDLAASLVLPLLRGRTDGRVVSLSPEKSYYTAGLGGPNLERVLVRRTDRGALLDLFRQGIDLVVTEREVSPAERAAFIEAFPGSDPGSRAVAEVVALDALTFLVQPDNPVRSLSMGDLRASRSWVGGQPGSPERVSAERFGFNVTQPVSGLVADAMLARGEEVGLGVYHLEGATSKARQLACQTGTLALRPSPFTIATEDYKYAYRITAYRNPRARADGVGLVRYMVSDKGQEIVSAQGYVDLRLRPSGGEVDPVILSTIAHALGVKSIRTAVRLSTNFRFRTGVDHLDINQVEAALDLKAQADLVRLPIELARDYPRAKVVILGFTDNSGTPTTNQPLSTRRADGLAGLLKQAGVDPKTAGLSNLFPVDTSDTEEGRSRNRRCEVWVVPD